MIDADDDHDGAGGAMQQAAIAKYGLAGRSKICHNTVRDFKHKAGNHQSHKTGGENHMLHAFGIVEPHKE